MENEAQVKDNNEGASTLSSPGALFDALAWDRHEISLTNHDRDEVQWIQSRPPLNEEFSLINAFPIVAAAIPVGEEKACLDIICFQGKSRVKG